MKKVQSLRPWPVNLCEIKLEMHHSVPFKYIRTISKKIQQKAKSSPQGYKTFFMLNSVEHKIFPAHKY